LGHSSFHWWSCCSRKTFSHMSYKKGNTLELHSQLTFNKHKTFSVLIYSYINTSRNWENEKFCGNTTPEGRSVFTQFRVFPISTSVDITIYKYGKRGILFCFII
jgi:hypothetical protein